MKYEANVNQSRNQPLNAPKPPFHLGCFLDFPASLVGEPGVVKNSVDKIQHQR